MPGIDAEFFPDNFSRLEAVRKNKPGISWPETNTDRENAGWRAELSGSPAADYGQCFLHLRRNRPDFIHVTFVNGIQQGLLQGSG
jgi:hypothetical protein